MASSSHIACPSCGAEINIEDVLAHDIEERLKHEYASRLDAERTRAAKAAAEAATAAADAARAESEAQLTVLRQENEQRKRESQLLKQREIELLDIQRRLKEKDEEMELLVQKRVLEERTALEQRIRQAETDRFELERKDLEKRLADQMQLVEEMKRKATLGSQQFTGETQELAIEQWLRQTFPSDTIEEIKKGSSGADCLQIVNEPHRPMCGRIYYESKRTKEFQPRWIEKFRDDMRAKNADIGVLVTETMPKDMPRFGKINGVWICTYADFKALCVIIRDLVVHVSDAAATQEHRGDKMALLYDYLTGTEFRRQVEAIVEGFTTMREDLDAERRAMERLWKQREKQLEKVLLSTSHMYGSIRGIAGNAIQSVRALELPGAEDVQ
jgi:hypothetical protein